MNQRFFSTALRPRGHPKPLASREDLSSGYLPPPHFTVFRPPSTGNSPSPRTWRTLIIWIIAPAACFLFLGKACISLSQSDDRLLKYQATTPAKESTYHEPSPVPADGLQAAQGTFITKQKTPDPPLVQSPPIATVPATTVTIGSEPTAEGTVSAEKKLDERLMYCVLPAAQYGQYSSYDGGKSARTLLLNQCPREFLNWVDACLARGDSNENCNLKAMLIAQFGIKQFGK
ncbi:MAG: hypothetical protein Q8K31_07090 [Burkholderiaceae bacterium]|nr:hypothetical protein [Burkholderiaceae bacterium]